MRKAFLFLFSTILFGECDGRIVSSIEIRINDLFTESQIDIVKTASNLKINTSPTIIKKIIPIKEGDICSSLKISETERKLRAFGVFRNVSVQTVNTNDNFVAVFVNVTDNWTITPRINFDSQKYSVKNFGLQDKNFLGLLKNLSVKKAEKELYDEIEISAQDKAFLNSDKRLNLVYSDKSEGKKYGFFLDSGIIDLIQPTGWSFQSVFDDTSFKRNGTEPVRVYLKEYIQIKGGYELQNPLAGGEWLKVGAGVRYENKEISRKGTDVPPELDYRWTGPYFRASLHKPAFKSLDYFNYFDFLEDIDVGFNFTTEVFLAPEILSSQNTVILSSMLNKGFAISEECLVFNTVRKQFRLEEFSNLENGVLDIKSDLYRFFRDPVLRKPSAILVSLNLLASRDLDVDREFALGGEKGLLGYKNNSLSNENIAYLKLEFRNTLIENYKKLFSVGQAFFLELGSSSDKFGELASDVLANVGVGLRFFFPDLSPPRIFRIDLGIPLRDSGEINSFEIRFTTSEEKQITKSLFEEPTLFEQFQDLGVLD